MHGAQDKPSCGTSAGSGEHPCRLGIQTHPGFQRLVTSPGGVPISTGLSGSFHYRPIRITDQCSSPSVLQLETRPQCNMCGCTIHTLGEPLPVSISTLRSHYSLSTEDQGGTVQCSPDRPSLGQPAVVPHAIELSGRVADLATSPPRHTSGTARRESSHGSGGPPPSSRLANLRQSYSAEGLSEGVISLISRSWRPSTESAYSCAWRQWDRWCTGRHIDPLSAPLKDILEFLLDQFQAGKQYRTINSIRSAISMTHQEVDGVRVGQHPLVTRFVRGVFNSRPPAPHYTSTWDVDVVLIFLNREPPNDRLSFQALSHKVAMLMALANADRCSDLAALDLRYRSFQVDGVKFIITGLTKTRRSGPPLEAFYPSFNSNPTLCPVRALQEYERRSESLRRAGSTRPLFISVRKPHLPVKPCTIGKWLQRVMTDAGIDTSIFSAHSTRGASTSKARASGVSSHDILKAANWSSESTFCRFYCRPIAASNFGRAVLEQTPPI